MIRALLRDKTGTLALDYEIGELDDALDNPANLLWLDRVDTMTQAELWLELRTPDTAAAAEQLDRHGIVRRDSVETLPEGFDGFWISGPGNIIHLVHGEEEDV